MHTCTRRNSFPRIFHENRPSYFSPSGHNRLIIVILNRENQHAAFFVLFTYSSFCCLASGRVSAVWENDPKPFEQKFRQTSLLCLGKVMTSFFFWGRGLFIWALGRRTLNISMCRCRCRKRATQNLKGNNALGLSAQTSLTPLIRHGDPHGDEQRGLFQSDITGRRKVWRHSF